MRKAIIQIDIGIVEADSKADSNDPNERAYWRNRTLLMQSEKLTLRNIQNNILAKETERERKETERERKETGQIQKETIQLDLILQRERKETERERKEADKVDGLIRLGKIGDSTLLRLKILRFTKQVGEDCQTTCGGLSVLLRMLPSRRIKCIL